MMDTEEKNALSFAHEALSAIPVKPKTCDETSNGDLVVLELPITSLSPPDRSPENFESPQPPAQSPLTLLAAPKNPEKVKEPLPPAPSPLALLAAPPKSAEKVKEPLPPAPSPLALLAAPPKSAEKVKAPLPPAQTSFNPLEGPPKSTGSVYDSPMAPTYSPLTPLVAQIKSTQNVYDSLMAPISPENVNYSLGRGENLSPLPAMSPSTLELFNTLSADFTLEMEKINKDNGMQDIVVKRTKQLANHNVQMDIQDQVTDFSSDTESDYIPDTDESEDVVSQPKSRNIIITKAILYRKKTIHEPDRIEKSVSNETEAEKEGEPNPAGELNCDPGAETECSNLKGRPKKGRKRKFLDYTLAERKQRKYANLSYQGKSKHVAPKIFKDYTCTCAKQCHSLISAEKREKDFLQYIALGSYEAQLLHITKCVSESRKKRAYTILEGNKTGKNRPRQFHRVYTICGTKVCKQMFLNTFQITPKKIDVCMKKNRSGEINDKRGKSIGGWNKTSEEDLNFIKNIIKSLPKYESHYRRENSDCQYLKIGMTIDKIYQIYIEEFKKKQSETKQPVSNATFKREFYKNFNLRCKTLKKDTCNRCDTFDAQIKNVLSKENRANLQREREAHLNRANSLRQSMNNDLQRAKADETFECLTYDLEKTLPLPRIPTNIVFYKRQLWLYNCGIHAGSSDIGHCYVWVEGDAGRGSQEVGSCLIHFIKNKLSPKVKHLVLWSDCCGGQNRNIKLVLMLKAVLNSHDAVKSITLKYLESGHTFLPNDTDFSKIETQLKQHERIYTPDEYIKVMQYSKKKKP